MQNRTRWCRAGLKQVNPGRPGRKVVGCPPLMDVLAANEIAEPEDNLVGQLVVPAPQFPFGKTEAAVGTQSDVMPPRLESLAQGDIGHDIAE